MNHPWMIVTGCVIFGWLLPEVLVAFWNVRVPAAVNFLSGVAGGLIAAGLVF